MEMLFQSKRREEKGRWCWTDRFSGTPTLKRGKRRAVWGGPAQVEVTSSRGAQGVREGC